MTKANHLNYTQPHLYVDKKLYAEYKTILKNAGLDLMAQSQLLFEKAIKAEIEAYENKPKNKNIKLLSEL